METIKFSYILHDCLDITLEFEKYFKENSDVVIKQGNNPNLLEIVIETDKLNLIKIRAIIEKELNEKGVIFSNPQKIVYRANTKICSRTFCFKYNGHEIEIDYNKLIDYKLIGKNTYYAISKDLPSPGHLKDLELLIEFPVDELIQYIGAENETIKTNWKGDSTITHFEIKNYKLFSKLNCDLSPHINILVGHNGLGKTSFLQALTLCMLPVNNTDINQFKDLISVNSNYSDFNLHWGDVEKRVTIFKNELKQYEYIDSPQKLILAYGTNFNTSEKLNHDDIIMYLINGTNTDLYATKSIFNNSTDTFFDPIIVLEKLFRSIDETKNTKPTNNEYIKNIISFLKNKINDYLHLFNENERINLEGDKGSYFFVDFNQNKIKTKHLSEGYKIYILQMTDIFIRILSTHFINNDPREINQSLLEDAQGLIIIDEFDRHLHPNIQRKFITQLQKDFKKMQFVLSTHNILSLQSAEGFTALILHTDENKKLAIKTKEIKKGYSIETIYNEYFDGNHAIYGDGTQMLLDSFKSMIQKQYKETLSEDETKTFKETTNELLQSSERIKNIVASEIRQLERLTNKTINL